MQPNYDSQSDLSAKIYRQESSTPPLQQSQKKGSYPMIGGILLLISGVIALVYWLYVANNVDFFTSMMDVSYLQSLDPKITIEAIKETLVLCGTIFSIIAIFPILGGVLALKRKLWGVVLACSVIGLFSIGIMFSSSILCLIALVLIATSKREFIAG